MLAKISLSLSEVLALEAELNGLVNPSTGAVIIEGFLKEKLHLGDKYWLEKLSNKLASEKKLIDKLRNELIEKYGDKNSEGQFVIMPFLDTEEEGVQEPNPKFAEFQQEFSELLGQEKEIEYRPLPFESLNKIESETAYSMIFKIVAEPNVGE